MKKIGIILICAALTMPAATISAQNSSSALSSMGRTADPVSAAIGGTSLVSSDPAMALASPAVLPFSGKDFAVSASYGNWYPDGSATKSFGAGVSTVIKEKFGIHAGFSSGTLADYEITDANGTSSGTFTPKDILLGAGFSWKFLPALSAGVNVKYAKETLYTDYAYSAVAADIFVAGKFSDFTATAGVGNIGGKVAADNGTEFSIPAYAGLGVAYDKTFSSVHSVHAAADFKYFFEDGTEFGIGAEYRFKKFVAVRAGYHAGSGAAPTGSYLSTGLGLNFGGFAINAAYLISSESSLGNTLLAGIGWSF